MNPNPLRPVIVLVPYRSTLPLVKPLQAAGYDIAMPQSDTARQLGANLALDAFLNQQVQMEAISQATVLAGRVLHGMNTNAIPERLTGELERMNVSLNGTGKDGMVEHVARPFMSWFPGWTHQSMTRQIIWLKAMERLCAVRDVRAAIVQNDVEEFTKSLCLFAVAHGIPAIHLPHSIYLDWGHGEIGTDVHDPVTADWVFTAGPYQTAWYKRRGARRIQQVGVPHWDAHAAAATVDNRREIRRRLKLAADRPVVAYYSSWRQDTAAHGFHDGIEVAYQSFLQASKETDWQRIVKTHPSARVENAEWHAKQADALELPTLVTADYLDLILKAQDVAVVYGTSATVIESAIYGAPVVSVNGFADDEAVITCGDEAEDIRQAVAQALSDEWRETYAELRPGFVQKYAGKVDGKATQRALEGVLRLAGKGR